MAKKKINPLEIEQKIVAVEYSDEMQSSYIDYAMSVIAGRALPDARDGLKPVHRRILYSMKELNLSPDSTYRKSARVVGDVLGKYHPHGDSAVYQAMVRMAQPFSLRNTLVDGHGNFGSIDGDGAAAMRYTEARLTHLSQELLKDSDKGIVEFKYNFDETLKEPCVLPARFPNLLVNGSSGIAVGMSTNIPSHNLRETIKATIAFMKDRDISYKKLMSYLKGPDFPTGGIIVNKDDLQSIYETGKGSIKIRANTKIEPLKNGKFNIVITEVPYTFSGSVEKFILKIVDLVKEKKVDELVDIRDESNREGLRIVLETKKGVNPELLLNKLYKISHLQDSFAADFIALVKNDYLCSTNEFIPKRLSLKMLLSEFISFQEELVSKKAKFELQKSMDRLEIVQGLVKAIDIIDTIIEVIRGSESDKDAKNCLMTGDITNIEFKTKASAKRASLLKFTDRQAEAILNMRLRKLSGLEINELVAEENSLIEDIEKNKRVLEYENERFKIIEEYLLEISDKYGDKRRTKIDNLTIDEAALKESKKVDDLTILLDKNGYIKSVYTNSLSRVSKKELDEFETVINTNSEDKLCMFTSLNKLHQLKVKDVPVGKIKDKGVPLDTIIPLEMCKETQTIAIEEILYMNSFENIKDSYICMITKNGLCKFIDAKEYSSFRSESRATKIVEGDELKIITILGKKEYDESSLVIFNQDTTVFKIKTSDIKIDKKGNKGNEILELGKKDVIVAGYIINEKEGSSAEIVTQEATYVINLNKIKLQNLKSKAKKLTGVPKSEIISISMKKSDEDL